LFIDTAKVFDYVFRERDGEFVQSNEVGLSSSEFEERLGESELVRGDVTAKEDDIFVIAIDSS